MENKTINLTEILNNTKAICSFAPIPDHFITVAMKEACRQVLELDIENVEFEYGEQFWDFNRDEMSVDIVGVNKQSILDTINSNEI